MPQLPTWYPGEEPKPAPMPLLVVQAFVNTQDLDTKSDLLEDADAASAWFEAAGLVNSRSSVSHTDLELARTTRESVRLLLEANAGEVQLSAQLAPLRELAGAHRPRLTVLDDGLLELRNARNEDLGDGLFELLLIIRSAQENGSWARLKACSNPACRWAFYDRSRNQQGNWCDMAVCGNRLKNRHLRARRRGTAT
jgi:predicted RNA-binding Zn ribbon-like protein